MFRSFFLQRRTGTGSRIDCLDGLRGFAVLFVLVAHLNGSGKAIFPLFSFFGGGVYGVYLFFVLSAYLLTTMLVRQPLEKLRGLVMWRRYFLRRFLRIYPLYTVFLFTMLGFSMWGEPLGIPMTGEDLVRHLTLQLGSHMLWTIPVECKYYLVLPVLVLAGTALPRRAWILSAAAVLLFFSLDLYERQFPSQFVIDLRRYLPAFLIGSLAACVHPQVEEMLERGGTKARFALEVSGWLALAAIIAHLPHVWAQITESPVSFHRFHRYPVRFGVLWTLCLFAALSARGPMQAIFSWTPLRFFGAISFSIYLWHMPIVHFIDHQLADHPALITWAIAASIVGLSTLSYLVIERPFLEQGRSLDAPRDSLAEGMHGGG